MMLPAGWPVLGSIPVVPETNTCDPALTPWLYSGELGAFGVVMICRGMSVPFGRFANIAGPLKAPTSA